MRKEMQNSSPVPSKIGIQESEEADDEENVGRVAAADGGQPAGGQVINMPALPPPLNVDQAPVAPPVAPNNARADPMAAPN